ncbi:MAG: DUF452 family protein [Mucinivorans sp.]
MQKYWIRKDGNERLLLMAMGWGASADVMFGQSFGQHDVVCLYDYRDMTVDLSDIRLYNDITLVGWSFGVWAAEQALKELKFTRAVALVASPLPINKEYGIDPRAFAITLNGIIKEGVVKFVTRMCGQYLREYMQHYSMRDLDGCRRELEILGIEGAKPYTPKIQWDEAILGGNDRIFPTAPAQRYWQEKGVKCTILEGMPHYIFAERGFIERYVLCSTTRS